MSTPTNEELQELGESVMSAQHTAETIWPGDGDEVARFVGSRAYTSVTILQLSVEARERDARREADAGRWTPMRDGDWRWRIEPMPAEYWSRWKALAQRHDGERWVDAGSELASTRWGARWAMGRIRRRHRRRFPAPGK